MKVKKAKEKLSLIKEKARNINFIVPPNNIDNDTNSRFWIVRNIALTAILLSLTLIFSFVANFIKIFGFLKIDISIIFVFISLLISGYFYSLTILFLKFLIAPSWSDLGYSPTGLLGHFILFIAFFTLISFFYILVIGYKLMKKTSRKRYGEQLINSDAELRKFETFLMIVFVCLSIGFTTVLMSILNTVLFNPLYFSLLGWLKGEATYSNLSEVYNTQI